MASGYPNVSGFDDRNIDASNTTDQGAPGQGVPRRQPSIFVLGEGHHDTPTRQINDVKSILKRRFSSTPSSIRQVELMGEDKIGANKIDSVHRTQPTRAFMMTFSPDGLRVASTHGDHRIYICDLNTGKLMDILEGHSKIPWFSTWHPTDRYILASCCLAGEIRVWNLRSRACKSWTIPRFTSANDNSAVKTSLSFHPKDRILMIATSNLLYFWDWSEPEPYATATTSSDKEVVRYVEFDSSGTKLITGISNLPPLPELSKDPHQTRTLDGHLTGNMMEQMNSATTQQQQRHGCSSMPTTNTLVTSKSNGPSIENMTLNSELSNSNNDSNPLNPETNSPGQTNASNIFEANSKQTNFINRSTETLEKVATLYRHLEALETNVLRTSLSSFMGSRQISSPATTTENITNDIPMSNNKGSEAPRKQETLSPNDNNIDDNNKNNQHPIENSQVILEHKQVNSDIESRPPTQQQASNQLPDGSQIRDNTNMQTDQQQEQATVGCLPIRAISYKTLVLLFDELLENIQLGPLIIDGQIINPSTVFEQYPADYKLYCSKFESINSVNQNFSRISKMMRTIKVYKQVVQQSLAKKSLPRHYPPNQVLSVQSSQISSAESSPRNSPLAFASSNSIVDSTGLLAHNDALDGNQRTMDPIMAIQFRNLARNVPIISICKIDLLCARSLCIKKSQELIEEAIASAYSELRSSSHSDNINISKSNEQSESRDHHSFYKLMSMLQRQLNGIKQAPLTTSNVHTLIMTLRHIINQLLHMFSTVFFANDDGQKLVNLAHQIAQSLTKRGWSGPLGATLYEIMLDVIHTLCITDLTLHIARQVQLLQIQRLTLIVGVAQSRRSLAVAGTSKITSPTTANVADGPSSVATVNNQVCIPYEPKPSTSRQADDAEKLALEDATMQPESNIASSQIDGKRTSDEALEDQGGSGLKKAKIEDNKQQSTMATSDHSPRGQMNVQKTSTTTSITSSMTPTSMSSTPTSQASRTQNQYSPTLVAGQLLLSPNFEALSPETILSLSGQEQSQQIHQQLRDNYRVLLRIYSRNHDNGNLSLLSTSPFDNHIASNEHRTHTIGGEPTRRRAMSQDNGPVSSIISALPGNANLDGSRVMNHVDQLLMSSPNQGSASSVAYNRMVEHSSQTRPLTNGPWHALHAGQNESVAARVLGVADMRTPGGTGNSGSRTIPYPSVVWMMPYPVCNPNNRLQCWTFSRSGDIRLAESQSNIVTHRCRIDNDSSVDISQDGSKLACLVPCTETNSLMPNYDLKIFSLSKNDFGSCYHSLRHGPNAMSVSLSPFGGYAIVGLASSRLMALEQEEDITIAKVYKLNPNCPVELVRDIKVKRDGTLLSLNAIRWLQRGIVYNVGPLNPRHYQARMQSRMPAIWMNN